MRILAVIVFVLLLLTAAFAPTKRVDATATQEITVTLSTTSVSTLTGDSFSFTSTVTNAGAEATPPLVANLDFVSLDGATYVDPEDWSHQRTLQVEPLEPGASVTQTWTVEPVLGGDIAAYVVVLPRPYDLASSSTLATSPAIHLHVSERRALNPGGVLPVVLAVPGILGVVALGLQKARRRI